MAESAEIVSDEDFEAFLNEELSDDESSPLKGKDKAVVYSNEASSVWWADDTQKDTETHQTLGDGGIRRSSFLKTSSVVSDEFGTKRSAGVESLVTASDSTIHEEQYLSQDQASGQLAMLQNRPLVSEMTDVTEQEEPETSVGADDHDYSHTASDPLLHSTLLAESQADNETMKTSADAPNDEVVATSNYGAPMFESVERHQTYNPANNSPSIPVSQEDNNRQPTVASNLLSQVQLSDTGSLDLTLQQGQHTPGNTSALKGQGSSGNLRALGAGNVDSSITEQDEDQTASSDIQTAHNPAKPQRPNSAQSVSGAVDKRAVVQAMSTLISEQVAGSADLQVPVASGTMLSETTESKTLPEIIAEMEALDSQEDFAFRQVGRPSTPPSISTDRSQYSGFNKSPYRPSSSQKTAKVRATGSSFGPNQHFSAQAETASQKNVLSSPNSTLRSGNYSSKIPLYAHVRSSGYGHPQTYMPMLNSRNSAHLSSPSSSQGGSSLFVGQNMKYRFGGSYRASEQYGGTAQKAAGPIQFHDFGEKQLERNELPVPYLSNFTKNASSQTPSDFEGRKDAEHWRHLWTESCRQINDLSKRLEETEHSLRTAKDRAKEANDSIARLRKTSSLQKGKKASEDLANARSMIDKLEKMLTAYQKDNEMLRSTIKDLETENQQLASAQPAELAHLLEEMEKLRSSDTELRRNFTERIKQFDQESLRLKEELRNSLVILEEYKSNSRSLEKDKERYASEIGRLQAELQSLKNKLEEEQKKYANLPPPPGKTLSKRAYVSPASQGKKAMNNSLSSSLFVEAQEEAEAEIARLKNALALSESELEKLRRLQIEQASLKEQSSIISSIPNPNLPVMPTDQAKVQKLEMAVRELENLLRERHPGSVPVAVLDVAAAEASANEEKIRVLEVKCRRLENENMLLDKKSVEKAYQAASFASDNDDRLEILRRHIAEQDSILARLRNEANEMKNTRLADQAEIVRLRGTLAIYEKQNLSEKQIKQDDVIQTLLRERAAALKAEATLKAELFDSTRRLEVYENRVRELMDQLADARSNHTPERRLFDRLLDRLAEIERRFQRREETLREIRAAAVFGPQVLGHQTVVAKNQSSGSWVDPVFLRAELDKLVLELHDLRGKAALENPMVKNSLS